MVQISLEKCFLRGVPWNPPWVPTGVKVPWSLKCYAVIDKILNFHEIAPDFTYSQNF